MKQCSRSILAALLTSIMIGACSHADDPLPSTAEVTAAEIVKVGTMWTYDKTSFDTTGAVLTTGGIDTVRIIGDTVVNDERWFVTSRFRSGDVDVVNGLNAKNGAYWKYMSGNCPRFTKSVTTPNFKGGMAVDESFDHIYCLMVSDGAEVIYKRTLVHSSVNVSTGNGTLPCMEFRETKYAADNLSGYTELTLFYHPVYGLIKKEVYGRSKGGTLYRSSVSVLRSLVRGS